MKSMVGSVAVVPPVRDRWDSRGWGQRSDGSVPPTQMPAHAQLTSAYKKINTELSDSKTPEDEMKSLTLKILNSVKRKMRENISWS